MQKEEQDLRDRTKVFAVRIVRMFSALPKTTEAQVLGKQLLRSGTSVGVNYREAFRARSKAEFIARCGDSLREIEQSAYWLEQIGESCVVTAERPRAPAPPIETSMKLLFGYLCVSLERFQLT
jgi:four helix bundle protein